METSYDLADFTSLPSPSPFPFLPRVIPTEPTGFRLTDFAPTTTLNSWDNRIIVIITFVVGCNVGSTWK